MPARRIWLGVGLLIFGAALEISRRRTAPVLPPSNPGPSLPGPTSGPTPGPTSAEAPSAPKDWRSALDENGLSRYAPALARLVRPAVELRTRGGAGSALAVGQSRIGGAPDLPPGFRWPTYAGKHLAFVAQIDLAEVARVMPDGPLPKRGHLWFFYAPDQERWGFDPKDAGSSVVHYQADGRLARRALPDDLPAEGRFAPCAVSLRTYDDIPDGTDARNPTAGADEVTQGRYDDARNAVTSSGATSHKLLGYPEPVQDAMELECAMVTNGVYMGDATGTQHPRFKELDATKYDWRLLMQIDSDDAAKMMWGDAGRLYFWIRDQDLRERRFDKAWMILQCG
jgi:uncharacterized protein YwqG